MTFNYLPVSSEIVPDKNSLNKIIAQYKAPLMEIGGRQITEEQLDTSEPLIYFLLTGGTENIILHHVEQRKKTVKNEPVFLLAHPGNNSLPASLETLAKLQQDNHSGRIFYFHKPNDKQNLQEIIMALEDLYTFQQMTQVKIGIIGEPSEWLVASTPSLSIIKKQWGPDIIPIKIGELYEEISQVTQTEIDTYHKSLLEEAEEIVEPTKSDIGKAVRVYAALKKIIKKYQLDGLTLRCFDLVVNAGTTGCYGLAKLSEEEFICGCEGDLTSVVAMTWAQRLLKRTPWMANPAIVNVKQNRLWLAHCTVPFSIINTFNIRSHFESGLGVGIQGSLSQGPVTLFRIGGKNMNQIWMAEGNLLQNGNSEKLCRTQSEIQLGTNTHVRELLHSPLGNHLILIPGFHEKRLMNWLNMYKPAKPD